MDKWFKQYRRTRIAGMRPYGPDENVDGASISQADWDAGSPKRGDLIARNPKNHADRWLVVAQSSRTISSQCPDPRGNGRKPTLETFQPGCLRSARTVAACRSTCPRVSGITGMARDNVQDLSNLGTNWRFLSFALRGSQREIAPMTDHRPRSSYESDNTHHSKAAARSAVRITIGQKLRVCYEVPQDMPHEMRTLLVQLAGPDE
jgi:hypothetical protein